MFGRFCRAHETTTLMNDSCAAYTDSIYLISQRTTAALCIITGNARTASCACTGLHCMCFHSSWQMAFATQDADRCTLTLFA